MKTQFRPLVLSVKASNWRMNDVSAQEADQAFQHVRRHALVKNKNTCQFCGFASNKWQEVHHVDDDHSNNSLDNLVTACSFCHMCQHIGLAGQNKEATLIWLPEIPQATLHHIVRAILVAKRFAETGAGNKMPGRPGGDMAIAQTMADGATSLMDKLRSREGKAQEMIGTADPGILGSVLQQIAMTSPEHYDKRAEYLEGIRLLPLGRRTDEKGADIMGRVLDDWMAPQGPYAGLLPKTWESFIRMMAGI